MHEDPMRMYRTAGQVLASMLRITMRCGAFALAWAVAWGLVYAAMGLVRTATVAQAIPEMSLRQGILAGAFWMGVFGLVHGLVSGGTFGLLESVFHRWLSVPASAVAGLIAAWLPLSELLSSVGPLRPAPLPAIAAIALLSACSGIASCIAAQNLTARHGSRIRASDPATAPAGSPPGVGIGCIVMSEGRVLLVRSRRTGRWSTPGGHLDFGETPPECAVRETQEEAGIAIRNVRFVAITNDVMPESGKHYVTVWMAGDPEGTTPMIRDAAEIDDVGWFEPGSWPAPLHLYFENLLTGETWPTDPLNLPFAGRETVGPEGR